MNTLIMVMSREREGKLFRCFFRGISESEEIFTEIKIVNNKKYLSNFYKTLVFLLPV